MTTKTKTASRTVYRTRKNKIENQQPLNITYHGKLSSEPDEKWMEADPHISQNEIADTENLVYLYLSEMGQTPKLNAAEEKKLGSQIEQGKYLSEIEKELYERNDRWPTPSEILLEVANRFISESSLFDGLCRYCNLNTYEDILEQTSTAALHDAIDGYIEPDLINYLAEFSGREYQEVYSTLTGLSLNNLIMCWPVLKQLYGPITLKKLKNIVKSESFWRIRTLHF